MSRVEDLRLRRYRNQLQQVSENKKLVENREANTLRVNNPGNLNNIVNNRQRLADRIPYTREFNMAETARNQRDYAARQLNNYITNRKREQVAPIELSSAVTRRYNRNREEEETKGFQPATERRDNLTQLTGSLNNFYENLQNDSEYRRLRSNLSTKIREANYEQYLQDVEDVYNEDLGFLDYVTTPITSAAADLVNAVTFSDRTGIDREGNLVNNLPNKSEIRYARTQEEGNAISRAYGNIAYTITQGAIAHGLNVVTGTPIGSIIYYGDIAQEALADAKDKGYNDNESLLYASGVTLIAGIADKFVSNLGGLTRISSKIPQLEEGLTSIFNRITGNATASKILGTMGAEGISESVEEYLNGSLGYIIDSDQRDQQSFLDMLIDTTPEAMYAGLIGGLSGGVSRVGNLTLEQIQEKMNSIDVYRNKLENTRPQSLPETQFKNDQLNKADRLYAQMEQLAQAKIDERKQQATDNQVAQSSAETTPQEPTAPVTQETTQEVTTPTQETIPTQETTTRRRGRPPRTTTQETTTTETPKKKQARKTAKKQIQEAKKVDDSVNVNLAEKSVDEVLTITDNSSDKEVQKALDVVVPTAKNKKTVPLKDGTKFIDPSIETKSKSLDEQLEVANRLSEREQREIQDEDLRTKQAYDSLIERFKDNTSKVALLEQQKAEDLRTVRHVTKEMLDEKQKIFEDPEFYVNEVRNGLLEDYMNDRISGRNRTTLEIQAQTIMDFYGKMDSDYYDSAIFQEFSRIWADLGSDAATTLATRKHWLYDNPQMLATKVEQNLYNMYKEEAKQREGDTAWIKKNNPKTNENSPYRLTQTQFNTINYFANELVKMPDRNSVEFQKAKVQLDSYITDIYGGFTFTSGLRKLTTVNVLASTRIWATNARGNFIQVALHAIDSVPRTIADKIIGTQTDIRTSGISVQGNIKSAANGFKKGMKESWYEFRHDVTLGKFTNKYDESGGVALDDLGERHSATRFNDNTKVGRALNKYSSFITLMNSDKPFAYYYYEASLYNQRLAQARTNATKKNNKKNYIYKAIEQPNTKMYKVSYIDPQGQRHVELLNKKKYNVLMKKSVVQDITPEMCAIAERESAEYTFQADTPISRFAMSTKNLLNRMFHIGDFGLGDIFLKFTRTGSNMAQMLYEHSPLQAIALFRDVKTLNENIKYARENKGTIDPVLQYKVVNDFGKLMGGTLLTSVVAGLQATGLIDITGAEEDDKEGSFLSNTGGFQPYSIRIGNYNYSLDNGSTVGSLIKIGTNIGDAIKEGETDLTAFLDGADTFLNELIEVSFLNNILDLTNTQYSSVFENVGQQLLSQPANMLPSFMKDISVAMDNFIDRQVYDDNPLQYMYNQIINRTPLRGSETIGLDPKKDNWGNVKQIGGDTLAAAFNTFYSTGLLTRQKRDPISDEIVRVYVSTTDTGALPKLTMNQNSFSYNTKTYNMTDDEKDTLMTTYAQTAHSSIEKLMGTDTYKQATDEDKLRLLKKAYDYADEKAKQQYIEGKGETFYNYESEDGVYTKYKKPAFEDVIEKDMSLDEANYKRNYNNSYKLKTAITNWEDYNDIQDDIEEIKETYSTDNGYAYKVRKYAVQTYISELSGLTPVQKAMLSKIENSKSDYANYDDAIEQYIDTLNLSDEEYQYVYDQLGLGGYWSMYWREK